MSHHIVVLGASGHVGHALAQHLLTQGHSVTAVARKAESLEALHKAGATLKTGQLQDREFITATLRGADAVFTLIPPNFNTNDFFAYSDEVGKVIADAVRTSGIKHLVHLSSLGADKPDELIGPIQALKRQEARLNSIAGLNVVHLRPAYFMENLLANMPTIQQAGSIFGTFASDFSFPMIATKDIAAYAASVLSSLTFTGSSIHPLLGAKDYSMAEAAKSIGKALGKQVNYVQVPPEAARQGMLQAGLPADIVALYEQMNAGLEKGIQDEARTAKTSTPTTLDEFAKHAFTH